MKVLLIDTTTKDLLCALITENNIVDVNSENINTHHSEVLVQKIKELMDKAQLTFADLDAYAVVVGPGSFTGIRIGISTIKGIATAVEKPFVSICSLQAIGYSQTCGNKHSAIIDAGNGYYFADYDNGIEPCLIGYDDERAKTAGSCEGALMYFDGAVEIVRKSFASGNFAESLSPIYIRRSQAEEKR